jgi:hypothetical protein
MDANSLKTVLSNTESTLQAAGQLERIRGTLARQAKEDEQRQSVSSDYTVVSGEFMANGSGEFIVPVSFKNVAFLEKPLLLGFGAEVRDWNSLSESKLQGRKMYPTISIVTVGWELEDRPPTTRIYKGAKLAVVVGGHPQQKLFVNWSFGGLALGGPTRFDPVRFV